MYVCIYKRLVIQRVRLVPSGSPYPRLTFLCMMFPFLVEVNVIMFLSPPNHAADRVPPPKTDYRYFPTRKGQGQGQNWSIFNNPPIPFPTPPQPPKRNSFFFFLNSHTSYFFSRRIERRSIKIVRVSNLSLFLFRSGLDGFARGGKEVNEIDHRCQFPGEIECFHSLS